jgi:phosphoglycerol transferase MdoB-like AlkP superfamily enzyme
MDTNDYKLKLIGLFILAFLLFNFPLLGLFSDLRILLGLPVLFWYLILSWVLIIFFTARLVKFKTKQP